MFGGGRFLPTAIRGPSRDGLAVCGRGDEGDVDMRDFAVYPDAGVIGNEIAIDHGEGFSAV